MRLGILASHPIQYQAPWFRALADRIDLTVYFAHRQSPEEQGKSGFGVSFDWDTDLLSGYTHQFLNNVSRRPDVNRYSGCDTPEIAEIIGDGEFDSFIVTGWYLKSFIQAARACRRANVPIFVRGDSQLGTTRSAIKRVAKEVTHRLLMRQFDGFLYVGKRNAEYLRYYGVTEDRMFFVPHFVDNDWFEREAKEARNQRAKTRDRLGVGQETLVALFVGKFQAVKRPADILQALAKLRSNGSNVVGVLIGAGELEQSLRAETESLEVEVRFEGFKNQSELPRYYAAADALMLPSESETWGLVVNEAMASGIPAIVSDAVGCAPDLIVNGITGFQFPTGDIETFADRLEQTRIMKSAGHDWTVAVGCKIHKYSVNAAVIGTLDAVSAVREARFDFT